MSKFSNLQPRLIAGFFGAVIIVGSLLFGQWVYFGIFFLIHLFCLLEFYQVLTHHGRKPSTVLGTIAGSAFFALSFLVESGLISASNYAVLFPALSLIFIVKL